MKELGKYCFFGGLIMFLASVVLEFIVTAVTTVEGEKLILAYSLLNKILIIDIGIMIAGQGLHKFGK